MEGGFPIGLACPGVFPLSSGSDYCLPLVLSFPSHQALVQLPDGPVLNPGTCKTEEELLHSLGLPYFPPELRNA